MTHNVRVLLIVAAICCTGCTSVDYRDARERAHEKIDAGLEAFKQGRAEDAIRLFTEATEIGPIGRDRLYDLHRNRAICAAKLGDFKAAQFDLNCMIEAAPDMADFYVVNSYVLQKQGQTARAKAAFRRAKRINRNVKPIDF